MFFSIEQIKEKIKPLAEKYDIPAVYLFGSYARGNQTDASDIDFAVEYKDSKIKTFFQESGFFGELERAFGKNKVDLFDLDSCDEPKFVERNKEIVEGIINERVQIYG
jgi:predicted nucleotidyltransferase